MGGSATMLALGGLYFREFYEEANLFDRLLEILKVPLDFFVKCYINDNEIYI